MVIGALGEGREGPGRTLIGGGFPGVEGPCLTLIEADMPGDCSISKIESPSTSITESSGLPGRPDLIEGRTSIILTSGSAGTVVMLMPSGRLGCRNCEDWPRGLGAAGVVC